MLATKLLISVYTEITGVRGAFSTKILYVLAQDVGTQGATYSLQIG
jgi:Tol biopolymer transport system component